MPWTPSPQLAAQARLEIGRLRKDMVSAQEVERERLAEQCAARGTLNSGAFVSAVELDIRNRLLRFAAEGLTVLIDLTQLAGASLGEDVVVWINQQFEMWVLSAITSFANPMTEMRRQRGATEDGVWDLINGVIFRAREDRDITIGRMKLQQSAGSEARTMRSALLLSELPKQDELRRDLAELFAQSDQVSVLFVDLDGFKQVNDTKGHEEGNRCLEVVVRVLQAATAGKGKVYRYGGDEFVIVLPLFDEDEAFGTAERIRKGIVAARPGDDLIVSASIGAAASGADIRTFEALINAADRAMYASKSGGKNRVTRFGTADRSQIAGSSVLRIAELLTAEISRNIKLTGRNTVSPERRHLDTMVELAEQAGWDSTHPGLIDTLHELRRRTGELVNLADHSQAAPNQHQQYYVPAADKARGALQQLLQPEVFLVPSSGPSPDLRLEVRNDMETTTFSAKARILAVRNDPNTLKTGIFALKWLNVEAAGVLIRNADSENLLIGRLSLDHSQWLGEVEICELSDGEAKTFERARWNMQPNENVPEFDLEISLFAENKPKPLIALYTVKPAKFSGPLEMIPRSI